MFQIKAIKIVARETLSALRKDEHYAGGDISRKRKLRKAKG